MGLNDRLITGQTPIDPDEAEGLLVPTITTQAGLNYVEQENIQNALAWLTTRKFKKDEIITEAFVKLVHRKMYDEVWKWAGDFRRTNKNIGVAWPVIAVELKYLLDNCRYWIDHETFPPDEIAVRFKYKIVSIHCFPNGNGRHSRLMADIIAEKIFGRPAFLWGGHRENYIKALKAADASNFTPLLEFARK